MDLARLMLVQEALEDWGTRRAEKPHEVLPVAYSSAQLRMIKAAAGMPLARFSSSLWGQHTNATNANRYGKPIQDKRVIRDWLKGARTMAIDTLWAITTKAQGLNWISASQALLLHLDLLERKAVIMALRSYLKRVRNRADYRKRGDAPFQLATCLATEIAARIALKCKAEQLAGENPGELRKAIAACSPERDADLLLLNIEIDRWKLEHFNGKTEQVLQAKWFAEMPVVAKLSEWKLRHGEDPGVNAWLGEAFSELGLADICHKLTTLPSLRTANMS